LWPIPLSSLFSLRAGPSGIRPTRPPRPLQPTRPAPPLSPSSGPMPRRHRPSGRLPSRRAPPPCPKPRCLHFPFRNGATPPFPLPLGADSRLKTAAPLNSIGRHRLLSSAAPASRPALCKAPKSTPSLHRIQSAPNSRSPCSKCCLIKKLLLPPRSTVARPNRAAPAPTNVAVRFPSVPSFSRCFRGELPPSVAAARHAPVSAPPCPDHESIVDQPE
jgi:hypothetical protein